VSVLEDSKPLRKSFKFKVPHVIRTIQFVKRQTIYYYILRYIFYVITEFSYAFIPAAMLRFNSDSHIRQNGKQSVRVANHGLYGSTSCCISHRPSQWERAIFDPPQLGDPSTDFHETWNI